MTDPKTLLDEIYEARRVTTAEGTAIDPFPHSSPRAATDALYAVATREDARRTLEVGLAYGLSALALCRVHEERGEGSHLAIDPSQARHWKDVGRTNLERAGQSHRFEFHEAESQRVLPRLWDEGRVFDLAFVDGFHTFDHCFLDAWYCDKLLRVGGVLAIDDLWMPAIRRVVAFMRTNRAYELLPTTEGKGSMGEGVGRVGRRVLQRVRNGDRSGLTFSNTNVAFLRKTKDDDRRWNDYAPF